jgi:SAM-dependent methyltransferase
VEPVSFRELKRKLNLLAATPLHPQWLTRAGRRKWFAHLNGLDGRVRVLDIGCSDKWPKRHISADCAYIGLDYLPTASQWYHTRPDVYADGSRLPVAGEAMDVVLLFDVGEHVPDVDRLFREIHRVLKPGGRVLVQIPFLYPLHDEPLDFIRLTRYGLQRLSRTTGFEVERLDAVGQPCETAALLSNLAVSKTVYNWFTDRSPALVLSVFLPLVVLKNNLVARLISRISIDDPFMPFGYQAILRKTEQKAGGEDRVHQSSNRSIPG